jgi:XTP/dITP diphosphohydrolase
MTLYPATTNIGKFSELAASAHDHAIHIIKLPGIDDMPDPVEDASTFMGNAEIKAVAYSNLAPGYLILADDSGLEVDSLDNKPGVRSARLAEDLHCDPAVGCLDARNNFCLLSLLFGSCPNTLALPSSAARYVCALAVARDGQVILRAEGEVQGQILDAPRGANGFGYDPLFLLPSIGLTMAELTREQKWEYSHRGNAFRSLLVKLNEARVSNIAHIFR